MRHKIHKGVPIQVRGENTRFLLCEPYFCGAKASLRWIDVTCKRCLKLKTK